MVMTATTLPAPDGAPSPAEAEAIRVEQLRALRRVTPLNMLSCLVVSVTVVASLWDHVPQVSAVLWCAAVWLLSLGRLAHWWWFEERAAEPVLSNRLLIHFATGISMTMGVLWGIGGLILYASTGVEQMFLGLILTGMAAAGAVSLSALPIAAIGFLVPLFLPYALRVVMEDQATHTALGTTAMLFIIVIAMTARELHARFISNVRMRVANQILLEDLQATRTDLLDAIATANEAFAIFDHSDRLSAFNSAYAELLRERVPDLRTGMTFQELTQRQGSPALINGEPVEPDSWSTWRLAQHRKGNGSYEVQRQDGRWIRTFDARTRRGGYVTLHVDITEQKEREAALQSAKDEAELANRAKSHFLALMSHELRTPLNAIIGFAEILESETFGPHSDPQYKEYAGDIRGAGDHLLKIINDILDLSKIEAGRMELMEEEIEIAALADDVVRLVSHTATQAQVTINIEIPHDLPRVDADLRIFRQMLLNLLSNAIKFTEAGGTVTVSADHDGSGVHVRVRDTGIGIAAADLPKVLEPFRQTGTSINDHQQGTGLGLPLVKSMIELHGGHFDIESTPDVGTTVTLTFGSERIAAAA